MSAPEPKMWVRIRKAIRGRTNRHADCFSWDFIFGMNKTCFRIAKLKRLLVNC
jgi:hypothetical protein